MYSITISAIFYDPMKKFVTLSVQQLLYVYYMFIDHNAQKYTNNLTIMQKRLQKLFSHWVEQSLVYVCVTGFFTQGFTTGS
jgi:hypothetical protein